MPFIAQKQKQMLFDAAQMSVGQGKFGMKSFLRLDNYQYPSLDSFKSIPAESLCVSAMCLAGSIIVKATQEGIEIPGDGYEEAATILLDASQEQAEDLGRLFMDDKSIDNIDAGNVFQCLEHFCKGGFQYMVEQMGWD